jgi:adenylate kinase
MLHQALRKKQMEMQQKDDERRRLLDEQNKKRVQKHMKACRLAEARHANATAKFYELMRKREEDYQRRQEV